VVYEANTHNFNVKPLSSASSFDSEAEKYTTFVNDSILEISEFAEGGNSGYYKRTTFSYLKTTSEGKIEELTSNRLFDFTKFIYMQRRHVQGEYTKRMTAEEEQAANEDGNIYFHYDSWGYDHLSVEDLDIMRNEIFADYGYRFKSEKWQKYFSKFNWYKPLYDNVDDQLTEIDKKNIEFILQLKEELLNNEIQIKKSKSGYDTQAAG
jgi:hypothetical protein